MLETGKPADFGDNADVVAFKGGTLLNIVNKELGLKAVLNVVEWIKDDGGIRVGQPLNKVVGERPEIVTKNPKGDLSNALSRLFVPGTEVSMVQDDKGVSKVSPVVRQGIKPPAS